MGLFNEWVDGKAMRISGEPFLVHRVTGAGQPPNRAVTLCDRTLWLFLLPQFVGKGVVGVETAEDVSCMACIAAECR